MNDAHLNLYQQRLQSPILVDLDVTSGDRASEKPVSYTIMQKHFIHKQSALKLLLHVVGFLLQLKFLPQRRRDVISCCALQSLLTRRNACRTSPCLVDRDVTSNSKATGKVYTGINIFLQNALHQSAVKHCTTCAMMT